MNVADRAQVTDLADVVPVYQECQDVADESIQMYAASTGGTASNLASVSIPFDSIVEGIQYTHMANLDAAESSRFQLSEIVTQLINSNGATGILMNSQILAAQVTAVGLAVSHAEGYLPVNLRFDAGATLYLHSVATAGVVGTFMAVLYLRRVR